MPKVTDIIAANLLGAGEGVGFILGVLNMVGFAYASGIMEQAPLPSGEAPPPVRTGPMIDKGMHMAAAALALGTLAEIGMSVKRMVNPGSPQG